jgi:hypothetical protein
VVVLVSSAFAVGFAIGLLIPFSVAGIVGSIVITVIIIAKSPAHKYPAPESPAAPVPSKDS